MSRRVWCLDTATEEARKYTTVRGFKGGAHGAYMWAKRHGVLKEITAFMDVELTDPEELLRRVHGELGSAARYSIIVQKMMDDEPLMPVIAADVDPEAISDGCFMDFEVQMNDQASEERSDKALDAIEALQKHGTKQHVAAAWEMYLEYQQGDFRRWLKRSEGSLPTSGYYMQGEEHGGSYE